MTSLPRILVCTVGFLGSIGVGCTETLPVDPVAAVDVGPNRLALDLGLETLDGAVIAADGGAEDRGAEDGGPDGETPDDGLPVDGERVDGQPADGGSIDAAADGGQNGA